MFPGNLIFLLARQHRRDLMRGVGDGAELDTGASPVTRVTLRWAADADKDSLRQLAALDSAVAPAGAALIAEVDGRLRAALPLDGAQPIADPFHRGADLVELLQLRAGQLRARAGR